MGRRLGILVGALGHKLECQRLWSDVGLPVPVFRGDVTSYDFLRSTERASHRRLFIKLRHGF